tara:strand:+ start:307 stop:546 length:240 start_codon:yes stop_codon:yes gene_type:complete
MKKSLKHTINYESYKSNSLGVSLNSKNGKYIVRIMTKNRNVSSIAQFDLKEHATKRYKEELSNMSKYQLSYHNSCVENK